MNCPKCANPLHSDERIFCTQCGAPLPRSFDDAPELFPERQPVRRWTLIAIAGLLVIFIVSPFLVGFRAKVAYQAAVDQIAASGFTARVVSYRQGWFTSAATIAVGMHGMQTVLAEKIHHGPYPIWTGWFSPVPVAAVVDSQPAAGPGAAASVLPADLLLRTIVYFNGRSRTLVTIPPRTAAGASGANFLGLDGEITPLENQVRVYLHSPGLIQPGLVGWSMTEFVFNGDWRRFQGNIWIGGSETTVRELNLSLMGGRGASLQLVDAKTTSTLNDGTLKFQGALRISSAVLGAERVGNLALAWELAKIDPAAIETWNQRAKALEGTKLDKQALMAAAQSGMKDFAIALAAKGPQLNADFTMATPDGTVTANLNISVTPGATNGGVTPPAPQALPAPETVPPAAVPMTLVKERVLAKATVRLPNSWVDRVAGAQKVNGWIQERTLVKDGSQYLLKADFAGGKLMVNGREVLDVEKLPPKAPPGAAGGRPKPA